uniref:carbonic anhydrase n=2 Tax=Cacopsylla melanoneura TaxID=428564 RepID=A0A8D8QP30_9HEMI
MKIPIELLLLGLFALAVPSCTGVSEIATTKLISCNTTTVSPNNNDETSSTTHHPHGRHNTSSSHGTSYCETGEGQSPIDIIESSCEKKDYQPIKFLDEILFTNEVQYENNCETVKITLVDKTLKPHVEGGALKSAYIVDNIHFHWGMKISEGCEHTINGQQFCMEAHMVMYKNSSKDVGEATKNKEIAVVSFLFSMNPQMDPDLKTMVHGVTEVLQPHTTFNVSGNSLDILKDFIGGGFYTYTGSLTTHNCEEGVLWMILKKPIPIAKTQLIIFHDIIGEDGDELQNWRKAKPLNGRQVFTSSF